MEAAEIAASQGCQLSIDLNYSPKIWEDRVEAHKVIATYCSYDALVKLSLDDWERTYQKPGESPENILAFIHELGAKEVCLTLGSKGVYTSDGEKVVFVPAQKIEVADATGAGDAFWSGYLTAWLDGYRGETCALFGRNIAEIKLKHVGPLTEEIDRKKVYQEILGN